MTIALNAFDSNAILSTCASRMPADTASPLQTRTLPEPNPPLHSRVASSVSAFARQDWDRLFPGRAEGWDYFWACELAAPAGFSLSAIGVYSGDLLVAAAPLFRVDYRLDMALEGWLRSLGDLLDRHAPRLVNLPILGIGSPLSEECPIGLHPGLTGEQRRAAILALLDGVARHARETGVSITALKDVTDGDAVWAHEILSAQGFTGVPALPVATLAVPFRSEKEYLDSLSHSTRKDLKKKLRSLDKVQVETVTSIDGIESEIVALFEETKAKRRADYEAFDEVPAGYFRQVVQNLGDRAILTLCRVGGELASFNLSLIEPDRIIGKYIGMRYPLAREHNVYFINMMAMTRLCIERRIPWLQTGQTTYKPKVRLGCQLRKSRVYFKHRGALMGPLFRAFGARMAFDRMDPDLRELGADAPYLGPQAA